MWYLLHVAFLRPQVAYLHRHHMQYQPYVAFPQLLVALPQLHNHPHMQYWPHVAIPQPQVALLQLHDM